MESNNIISLLQSAIAAPSGHNTQPWKFKVDYNIIRMYPDYSRNLPVVDPDNRELFISLGCALENLVIDAGAKGYLANIQLFPTDEKDEQIRVVLENTVPKHDPLGDVINKRQSNRRGYSYKAIPKKDLEQIKGIVPYNKVRVDVFTKSKAFDTLMQFVKEGNSIQMRDNAFKKELKHWMRFNRNEREKSQDGLCYDALGFPALPGFIGPLVINRFLKPDKQNRTDLEKLNSSSALVLFSTSEYTKEAWINLGRTFQRLALHTTLLGIAHAHINQPIEVNAINQKLTESLGLSGYNPSLMIRLGYACAMPKSPRRPVDAVLVRS